jgi:hypothetical protein
MIPGALPAAVEINSRWHDCLDPDGIIPPDCPSDSEVAKIIERHIEGGGE